MPRITEAIADLTNRMDAFTPSGRLFKSGYPFGEAIDRLAALGLEKLVLRDGEPILTANAKEYAGMFAIPDKDGKEQQPLDLGGAVITTQIQASKRTLELMTVSFSYEHPALRGLQKIAFGHSEAGSDFISTVSLPDGRAHSLPGSTGFSYEGLDVMRYQNKITTDQIHSFVELAGDIFDQRTR